MHPDCYRDTLRFYQQSIAKLINVLLADMAYVFDCKSKEGSSNLPQDSVKKIV